MKHLDAIVELQAIKTICDSDKKLLMLAKVNEEYFGSDQAKEVYRRIFTIISAGKDVPSSEVLKNDETLSEASRAFISNPSAVSLTTETDIEAAWSILARYRKARVLLEAIGAGLNTLKEANPDIDSVVTMMEGALQRCHSGVSKNEMTHYSEVNSESILQKIQEELSTDDSSGIGTGFREFDKQSGGFKRKSVVALASVPGGGKSAMSMQMAMNQASMGYNICFLSYEMDEIELRYRMLASIAKIDHGDINLKRLTPKKIQHINNKFKDFLSSLKNNRLTLWHPDRELSIPEIAMELKAYNYDVVYIDYIQLLKLNEKKQLWENLGDHARQAKLAANNLNCVMVLLAQYDDKENKLKYSSAIKANASFVWAWDNNQKEQETGIVEVKQLKARNAAVYPFYLMRDFKTMTFTDYNGPPPPKEDEEKAKEKETKKELPKMPILK